MEEIRNIERLIQNYERTWGNYNSAERQEIGREIAHRINRLNKYARSELWNRIFRNQNVLRYVAPHIQT